jgi:hypothetical protein
VAQTGIGAGQTKADNAGDPSGVAWGDAMPDELALVRSACWRCIAFSTLLLLQPGPAWAVSADVHQAATYCANEKSSAALSEDGMIFCFDGPIHQGAPIDRIEKLKDGGFFVVRSPGGDGMVAMKIADVLMERHATVIVRDYCFSACANYLLVATSRAYVLKDSLVAWHRPPVQGCSSPRQELTAPGDDETLCKYFGLERDFFRKRGIESRHIFSPRTTYTRMMLDTLARTQGHRSQFFWMWNPRNYGDYFKDRIVYERYPRSQSEVNAIVRRLRLGRPDQIIFDPEL